MKTKLIALSLALAAVACSGPTPRQKAEKEAEARARELLQQLSVPEKASLLVYNSPAVESVGIKSYNWWNEALRGEYTLLYGGDSVNLKSLEYKY